MRFYCSTVEYSNPVVILISITPLFEWYNINDPELLISCSLRDIVCHILYKDEHISYSAVPACLFP